MMMEVCALHAHQLTVAVIRVFIAMQQEGDLGAFELIIVRRRIAVRTRPSSPTLTPLHIVDLRIRPIIYGHCQIEPISQ